MDVPMPVRRIAGGCPSCRLSPAETGALPESARSVIRAARQCGTDGFGTFVPRQAKKRPQYLRIR